VGRWAVLAGLLLVLDAAPIHATPFVFVGPRPVGMGGAGVAATYDSEAVYWNPANLTWRDGFDIRLSGAVRSAVELDTSDLVDKIKDGLNSGDTSVEKIEELERLISQLENDGAGSSGGGGLFVKYNWGSDALGFSFLDVGNGTANLPVINPNVLLIGGALFNGTIVSLDGLESREIALSYAHAFFDRTLSIGVTAKAIQGIVYLDRSTIQRGDTSINFIKDFSSSLSDWDAGVDVGVSWAPLDWLRIGAIGKNLNTPSFNLFNAQTVEIGGLPPDLPPAIEDEIRQQLARNSNSIELAPQGRAGVAFFPLDGMTLSGDIDLAPNPTFVKGIDSQIVSAGAEQLFFDDILATRLGIYSDFGSESPDPVPSFGIGVSWLGISADFAGAYDFQRSAGGLAFGIGYTGGPWCQPPAPATAPVPLDETESAPAPHAGAAADANKRLVLRGVTFDFDSAQIRPDAMPVLEQACSSLKAEPDTDVVCKGYTDDIGTPRYNLRLSERRADAVCRWLVHCGVSAGRVSARGYGEADPVASNATAEGRAQNRRTELVIPDQP
jgi:outer membrane protein OmpA-like peptidoglycan-associated protein